MNNNQRFLIVCDLDGTLLDDGKEIMPKTKAYLKKLKAMGHVIAFASGRPMRSILPYYQELGLDSPIITMNGASVLSPLEHSDFKRVDYLFSSQEVRDFLSAFEEGELVHTFAESDKVIYYSDQNETFNSMFDHQDREIRYGNLLDTLHEDVYAFVFAYRDDVKKKVSSIPLSSEGLYLRHWYDVKNVAEFGSTKMNKSSGIRLLQEYYHIDRIHTIAFGDAENDTEMLSYAGVPYAMKNGNPRLKIIAGNVTEEDNCHEGIYLPLRHFFEGK